MGLLGHGLSYGVYSLFGLSSLLVCYGLLALALRVLKPRPFKFPLFGILGFFSTLLFISMGLHLFLSRGSLKDPALFSLPGSLGSISKGGFLGAYGIEILLPLLGFPGSLLVCITGLWVSLLVSTSLSYRAFVEKITSSLQEGLKLLKRVWGSLWPGQQELEEGQDAEEASLSAHSNLSVSPEDQAKSSLAENPSFMPEPVIAKRGSSPDKKTLDVLDLTKEEGIETARNLKEAMKEPQAEEYEGEVPQEVDEPQVIPRRATEPLKESHGLGPKQEYIKFGTAAYQFPALEILDYKEQRAAELDRKAMLELAQRLEKSLADYQVKGRVSQIHPGPVVTMYEFVPSPGTKLSKITSLASDLAMTLEALRVRIVAPIPGKAAVGIEVPNTERETVYVKEILADQGFAKAKSNLTLALGKDIAGLPVSVDLAKMPHLLIAGTTGSGKSVAVNVMVSSILFRASPDDVKMIMIDPKMLELSIYEGIPHLLLPVVTDPKKANLALKWAVDEMERRYDLISKSGVRDIAGYNQKMEELLDQASSVLAKDEGASTSLEEIKGNEPDLGSGDELDQLEMHEASPLKEPPRKLPYIVVLIDEFADLMMVASKEVEVSVARIAQKARAAGIHLILATQRPSVDVITGLIKANFPSRIAFQVASRVDSRTILDTQGAENLLGMGDMLFTDRGQALRRIHGALITDKEIHKLVEHLKKQGRPIYNMDILKPREEEDGEIEEEFADDMYDQAVRIVVDSRQASISMVQRRLRIGYNRAARMIERMEREGIVSAADGSKGREVLVQSH